MDKQLKLCQLIRENSDLMEILEIIESLNLPEGCLCAGAIRNTLWNKLSQKPPKIVSDVDVIFYDESVSYEQTVALQVKVQRAYPKYEWEVKNQYYMGVHHPLNKQYNSVVEGIQHFPERCTAVGARKVGSDIEIIAPYGLTDLFHMVVQPTPTYQQPEAHLTIYRERVAAKNWQNQWPNLVIKAN